MTASILTLHKGQDDPLDLEWLSKLIDHAAGTSKQLTDIANTIDGYPITSMRPELNKISRDYATRCRFLAESLDNAGALMSLQRSIIEGADK